ncbi:hypothetical protein SC10_B2orf02943 [Bacillus paralicheniformis]|nr:hypothetical protein SC10_B2orf02943 [Bacillus paralicheniformis]
MQLFIHHIGWIIKMLSFLCKVLPHCIAASFQSRAFHKMENASKEVNIDNFIALLISAS